MKEDKIKQDCTYVMTVKAGFHLYVFGKLCAIIGNYYNLKKGSSTL